MFFIFLGLESAAVSSSVFHWFKNYLDNRMQYVPCNSTESKSLALQYGVPQGSVFGPTLFCARYNDVTLAVKHSSCTLFADNNEMHYSDGDINKASNCINRDPDNISSRLSSNQMVVHPGKSEVIKIGAQRSLKTSNDLNIFIHDHRLTNYINILVCTSIVPWLGKSIFHTCKKERIQKSVL